VNVFPIVARLGDIEVVNALGCDGCMFERRQTCGDENGVLVCAHNDYRPWDGIVVFIPAGTLEQFVAERVTRKLLSKETS
jgi:hypothetical protein